MYLDQAGYFVSKAIEALKAVRDSDEVK
jgi:hypothetical protein